MTNSWEFFSNKDCEYFPCHKTNNEDCFNCMFCYCPLYQDMTCGGNYKLLANGMKDCSNCLVPHTNARHIISRLKENYIKCTEACMED